ncbi:hypothetical protein SAMN05192564_104126 [Paraburkholderia sartisoli]|uniref:Uncharacterized protein n=1 Tax=Paraburkholderia sartisoli TaxID=83784 RepID=A0A1H4F7L8_9BURK|nr:hypothetical protein SAMN05192564_104126 [Paraburkholderia sartisoli]
MRTGLDGPLDGRFHAYRGAPATHAARWRKTARRAMAQSFLKAFRK